MRLYANAKINLTLDIVGKRADGYHLIDSVMQSVSLCDEVTVNCSDSIIVLCDRREINQSDNIAFAAAKKFFEFTNISGGAEINIKKNIPMSAGLGGGSADAAAVIVALNKIYDTKLTQESLCEIGLSVGADVPFCIVGGTARVGGIGEKLMPIAPMPDCRIMIIKKGEKLSTADMYKKIDNAPSIQKNTETAVKCINNNDLDGLCKSVGNAFCAVSECEQVMEHICETSPLAVSLSGSGPSVFGIYKNDVCANKAAQALFEKGYESIITAPKKSGLMFE